MSDSASGSLGGTPSTTTPIAGPWLSPQVVKRNSVPNELPAIVSKNNCSAAPLRRTVGEREGPAPKAWEGEVACRRLSDGGATHLTPTLSPRKRAEREKLVRDHAHMGTLTPPKYRGRRRLSCRRRDSRNRRG